jgi:NADPH:quinone reductase-like Zn-dependent oxidoreductase
VADHRALVITKPGAIALLVDALVPGPGEVVARPAYVGVCGTDLELLDGVVDPAYVRYPLVPGYEWSGLIEAVGPGASGLTPGQPVIAEGIIPDQTCPECVRGNTNLCLTYDEIGSTRAGAASPGPAPLRPTSSSSASAPTRRSWPKTSAQPPSSSPAKKAPAATPPASSTWSSRPQASPRR